MDRVISRRQRPRNSPELARRISKFGSVVRLGWGVGDREAKKRDVLANDSLNDRAKKDSTSLNNLLADCKTTETTAVENDEDNNVDTHQRAE
ncbi:hypothetical protein OUZ56_018929 [Daphnia magna]|uniref:Uncharacterized protein n=1 Tax=Daphnia magna TaxID=35525 RepID=A0ABQ9ZA58_9CRUS|nr:hypothetical protein OUZ56_018929 [Daphnia magna]